ncbi:MAG: HEAT repeat domain-containing protein [Bacillota bacterium]|nr:HEAT repeat domain-containing protein [Bacillota bacterium]
MGLFRKPSASQQKEDPIITALRNLGSANDKLRDTSIKTVLGVGQTIIPTLIDIINSTQVDNEWQETQNYIDQLDYSLRSGINDLLYDLNSSNTERLKNAEKRLKKLPPDGRMMIESLAELKKAREMSTTQRITAINLLSSIGIPYANIPQVIQSLINAFTGKNYDVSNSAKDTLIKMGNTSVPYLIQLLKIQDTALKTKIIAVLESIDIKSKEAVPYLAAALSDNSRDIRNKILTLLGKMGELAAESIPSIFNMQHFDENLAQVESTLGKISKNNINLLLNGLTHANSSVRTVTAEVLETIGRTAAPALPVLYRLLSDNDPKVKIACVKAISSIGADLDGVLYLLGTLSENDSNIYKYASAALAALGKTVIPPLIERLAYDSPIVRRNAAFTLEKFGENALEAMPALEKALNDNDNGVVSNAILAIGSIGSAARPIAPKLLNIWKQRGNVNALTALCKMHEPTVIDILLRNMFYAPHADTSSDIRGKLKEFIGYSLLSEEIIDWAIKASTYDHKYHGYSHDPGYITLEPSNDAIRSLCNIKSNVTSNILHIVAQKKDVSVHMSNGCGGEWSESVNFQEQRNIALSELQARGNPPYKMEWYISQQGNLSRQIQDELNNENERRYRRLLQGAMNSVRESEGEKWKFFDELVKDFKTPEVMRLLVSDLSKYKMIPMGDLNHFEWLLVQVGESIGSAEAKTIMYPLQGLWPQLYSSVIKMIQERIRA